MPLGLGQNTLARVNQDHGQISGRCPSDHVSGVLFMPRCIGHDELALFGCEETIGHVDGDALLTLSGQAIDQQGKVDLLPLRSHLFAVGFQRGQLIFENHFRVIK